MTAVQDCKFCNTFALSFITHLPDSNQARMFPLLITHLRLSDRIIRTFIQKILISTAVAFALGISFSSLRPAQATDGVISVYLPLYGQAEPNDMRLDAESMAADAINSQFAQDPDATSVQVSVLGDRNGEIIPILTITVSRLQWQQSPQISSWARYHNAYALFQRHDQERIIAAVPARPDRWSRSIASQSIPPQVEAAYDAGTLSGAMAQDYLSELD